jgi:Tat protein translocase TatB subunit
VFLFIFESIGTSELILIGIVALIFLGPRKMPEYAKKIGKVMADFRTTTNEFKQTWEREVNFDEEAKAFKIDDDEPAPVARVNSILDTPKTEELEAPSVKEIDPASFQLEQPAAEPAEVIAPTEDDLNDKKNWL